MKPKDAKVAFESIAPYLSENTAILSVLAGIAIETIEKALGVRPIARVMPNTSAKNRYGVPVELHLMNM